MARTRRTFIGELAGAATLAPTAGQPASGQPAAVREPAGRISYPRRFTGRQLRMIAFPLGGIGTGTISLGGRGQLRDWEIFNRPDKGNTPTYCFFAIWAQSGAAAPVARVLESRIQPPYETTPRGLGLVNAPGLPRLRNAVFEGDYPFARIAFSDDKLPVGVRLEAFNPLVPNDTEASSLPVAILRYTVRNPGKAPVKVSIAYSQENPTGPGGHHCEFRQQDQVTGLLQQNPLLAPSDPLAGSFAIVLLNQQGQDVTHLKSWKGPHPRVAPMLFWEDFKADGRLSETGAPGSSRVSSLCAQQVIPPGKTASFTFVLGWHFPNRTPARCGWRGARGHENEIIGNHYCTRFRDAWEAASFAARQLPQLERRTRAFVEAVRSSTLPPVVIEAAMANLSTLRTQTCFRTADGRFYGFEGCMDQAGCCFGSCTHVWNYEQATAFLFSELARSMRENEFEFATDDDGCMSFRQILPPGFERLGRAAADGQMGCLMKLFRDWQLSGDTEWLRRLWPKAKKALEFAWIHNGWDGDRDGVMEGVQHNTYDVEFSGPNPLSGVWYLGALRASEEMARALGEERSAAEYRRLFENGSRWIDQNLFNGEYYVQQIRSYPPEEVPASLVSNPAGRARIDGRAVFQLGDGCLCDQLVGQYFAHLAGLGYLLKRENVRTALRSVFRYNFRESLEEHESVQRVYALNDEAALLICSFPKGNPPEVPFWFATETMTGFEYQAAVHMFYEGMLKEGLRVFEAIRERYDGERRNPWNEAECGHHYARAMASWAALPALAGFQYSAVSRRLAFRPRLRVNEFRTFWSVPAAWGTFSQQQRVGRGRAVVEVSEGRLRCQQLRLGGVTASAAVHVMLGGRKVPCKAAAGADELVLSFEQEVTVEPGQKLEVRWEASRGGTRARVRANPA